MSLRLERWHRSAFLVERDATFRRAKSVWERRGRPEYFVIVGPPADGSISCDTCNNQIEGDQVPVLLNDSGRVSLAICESCVIDADEQRARERMG